MGTPCRTFLLWVRWCGCRLRLEVERSDVSAGRQLRGGGSVDVESDRRALRTGAVGVRDRLIEDGDAGAEGDYVGEGSNGGTTDFCGDGGARNVDGSEGEGGGRGIEVGGELDVGAARAEYPGGRRNDGNVPGIRWC